MAVDDLEPVSPEALFKKMQDRLEALETAFKRGLGDAQQVVDLWEMTWETKLECERFYQFLLNYGAILNGLLWAHYPQEYKDRIYPRIQEAGFSDSSILNVDLSRPTPQPKTMLAVAEEIFLIRTNEPLSISELIQEMSRRGVRFKAKEPAKSLAQAMRNSGRFEAVTRGMYRLKQF
ncbi:hypothetical protein MYX82_01450 [Acidobacteria bacterium AH-259-D05]|nr:hypothetical protein [Acidobacteria bacterium AH-259-D05]